MKNTTDLMSQIYQLHALCGAVADAAERCTFALGSSDDACKLDSLIYLAEDYSAIVKETAERTLDIPTNRLEALEQENERLRSLVITLELKQ